MHIVTFYSFKGGVGRTMALVNVAFELASKGRRVLVVDFDLEAPGLSSYAELAPAAKSPGVVDYVTGYLETGEAPAVSDFITKCAAVDKTPIWFMPAGRLDRTYANKYASIDWQALYSRHEGYLMFEDLKEQWRSFIDPPFHYVLIDSRTGHTDVGGICTRQLPDATALMFFPNKQNIDGLETVVRDIRQEKSIDKNIELLFCPSNVPDLDDEADILRNSIEGARERLRYRTPASIIYHYNSLELLKQTIFVIHRPKTKLSGEYRALVKSIVKGNLQDSEGALAALEDIMMRLRAQWRHDVDVKGVDSFFEQVTEQIEKIQRFHPKEGAIAWKLASLYSAMGNLESEYDALTIAIKQKHRTVEAHRRRATNSIGRKKPGQVVEDVQAVFASEDASAFDLSAAITLLMRIDSDWTKFISIPSVLARLERLEPGDRLKIAGYLNTNIEGCLLAAAIAKEILGLPSGAGNNDAKAVLIWSLIGAGQFGEALETIAASRDDALKLTKIERVFNYAMAEWGATGRPPRDLLNRVTVLASNGAKLPDANYHQCMALVYAVMGDKDQSLKEVRRARQLLGPGLVLSCWRYLSVNQPEMLRDLAAIRRAALTGEVYPNFLRAESTLQTRKKALMTK